MKSQIIILFFLITCAALGQNFAFVESQTESYYKILKDSIDIKQNYPDGQYKVYLSDTSEYPIHVFNLKNNKVFGPYLDLSKSGWTYGTYSEDPLWTFLKAPNDTTYKIGTWRNHIYALGASQDKTYKIPYDSNGMFVETWYFHSGEKVREAIFKKGFGLEKETYWDIQSNKISKQIVNSGNEIFFQSVTYQNDSISSIRIIQNGIEVNMNFDVQFLQNKNALDLDIYKENSNSGDLPIVTLSIDEDKSLSRFSDIERQIFITEKNESSVDIEYQTKKGKRKRRTAESKRH